MHNVKKIAAGAAASVVLLSSLATATFAAAPGAAVKNPNANPNACWGMDRSFYTSSHFFPENQDLKQSFPGDLNEQFKAWVATYCDPHGPQE